MKFAKAHGTGNDFVVLPDSDGEIDLTPELIRALCDRQRGIGADGVLRVIRSAKLADGAGYAADAEWFMDYHNSDGSVSEMCGNGVRAFARYLVDARIVQPARAMGFTATVSAAPVTDVVRIPIGTRSGIVIAEVTADTITVDMPRPVLAANSDATVAGTHHAGTSVSVGNPHLVCMVPSTAALASLDLTTPPGIDDAAFPTGANVEFVAPAEPVDGTDAHVRMRVYERGSTETLSCGSGACAVAAVVLRDAGLAAGTVAVDVPGGALTVTIDADGCRLAGPAVVVATGEVFPAALGIEI